MKYRQSTYRRILLEHSEKIFEEILVERLVFSMIALKESSVKTGDLFCSRWKVDSFAYGDAEHQT